MLKVFIENDGYLSKLGINTDRSFVIEVSTRVEGIITLILAKTLRIIDYKSTTSFGNSNSALSFFAKLNLFLDLNGITKEQKSLLENFSFIRNKFAHLSEMETYYDVFSSNKDCKNFIERRYSSKIESYTFDEENCQKLFKFLLVDIEVILLELYRTLTEVAYSEGAELHNSSWNKRFKENIFDVLPGSSLEITRFINEIHKKTNESFQSTEEPGQ